MKHLAKTLMIAAAAFAVALALPTAAVAAGYSLDYYDEAGNKQTRGTTEWRDFEVGDDPKMSDDHTYTKGWHAVTSSFTYDGRIGVAGNVQLILCDGCTLTVKGGL